MGISIGLTVAALSALSIAFIPAQASAPTDATVATLAVPSTAEVAQPANLDFQTR